MIPYKRIFSPINQIHKQDIVSKIFYSQSMTKLLIQAFTFLNQKILRNTKQSSVNIVGVLTILNANFFYDIRWRLRMSLKLQDPNKTLTFPLPNRWSNPNKDLSKQQIYMVIKQVGMSIRKAGLMQREEINSQEDRCRSVIDVMGFFDTIHVGEMANVYKVEKKYSILSEVKYNKDRELLFADSLVNGEASYMLRKYGVEYYELPGSKQVDEGYRAAFEKAIQNEAWNENAEKLGLSKAEIIRRVTQNEGVYTMLYEHLEDASKGEVIKNQPEVYIENQRVDEMHYLHVPYPIFLRVKVSESEFGFICIGVGVRLKGQVKIFSPFFASQGEKIWRLVQSHVAQAAFNDFSVRIHLGLYHFTTNQYHVPMYRFLAGLSRGRERQNFNDFVEFSYGMFSRGLEGVNVAATASLVHPIPKYSLVNKALNLSQQNAMKIIANTSNNLKIYEFDPVNILKKNGLTQDDLKYFDKLSFDLQLYEILSEYIRGVFEAFEIGELSEKLMAEINEQTKHMAVGAGKDLPRPPPRAQLRTKEDVLKTIQNLCFCWVGFHSHTFSAISLATYTLLRPTALKRQIPETGWENILVGDELADSKQLMQAGKLTESTTQRDSDNYLMDCIRRQAESASYLAEKHKHDKELIKAYGGLEKTAWQTLERLKEYEAQIEERNRERKDAENLSLEWMVPSRIQGSLNI